MELRHEVWRLQGDAALFRCCAARPHSHLELDREPTAPEHLTAYVSLLDTFDVSCKDTVMIRSFKDKRTERIFRGQREKRFPPDITRRARMRLQRLDAAITVDDLRVPPSHRLEKLSGDRAGQRSIRINDQYRVCFEFRGGDAYDVDISDYH